MTFAAFRHVRLSPYLFFSQAGQEGDQGRYSSLFLLCGTHLHIYKLCKEPSKAQIKKTFPILSFYHTFQPVRYIVILSEALSRPNNIGILAIHSHSRPGALTLSSKINGYSKYSYPQRVSPPVEKMQ
jgi:hypothetical protein